jgi:hypothetical protein
LDQGLRFETSVTGAQLGGEARLNIERGRIARWLGRRWWVAVDGAHARGARSMSGQTTGPFLFNFASPLAVSVGVACIGAFNHAFRTRTIQTGGTVSAGTSIKLNRRLSIDPSLWTGFENVRQSNGLTSTDAVGSVARVEDDLGTRTWSFGGGATVRYKVFPGLTLHLGGRLGYGVSWASMAAETQIRGFGGFPSTVRRNVSDKAHFSGMRGRLQGGATVRLGAVSFGLTGFAAYRGAMAQVQYPSSLAAILAGRRTADLVSAPVMDYGATGFLRVRFSAP